jgi:hypothetical protein
MLTLVDVTLPCGCGSVTIVSHITKCIPNRDRDGGALPRKEQT